MRWKRGFFIEAVVKSMCSVMVEGKEVWRAIGWEWSGVPFAGGPEMPLRALRSQSAVPAFGRACAGCGGFDGIEYIGIGCGAGGAAAGLLNCASKVARLAVGVPDGAGAAAGGTATGVVFRGGKVNDGGWNGAGAGIDDDCVGVETRLSNSARLSGAGLGVGAGWGVCCMGGRKLARSCATLGALLAGAPFGGYCGA